MFDGIPLGDFTAPTLVGICVLLVVFGRLVPWYIYNAKVRECERWQKAYEAERDARAISDAQTAELLELAKTTRDILDAMFNTSYGRHRSSSGGPHVASVAKE